MKERICLKCNEILDSALSHYGLHPTCFDSWFLAGPAAEFTDLSRKEGTSIADPLHQSLPWKSSFFHGRFLKYSAVLGKYSYIIKIQEETAPELPYVEYLCNIIGKHLKIAIPQFYLIEFYGKPAFVTQNLISIQTEISSLEHIYHYVNQADAYNIYSLIDIIYRETNSLHDIDHFIDICLFDALIGNHDRHGRNLGFIRQASGKRLSPAYDNTSVFGLEQGSILKAKFSPKGKIYTSFSNEPTMIDYINEFQKLGYSNSVHDFVKRININEIDILIRNSFCSSLMKEAISKLFYSRYLELCDAI